MNYEDEANIEVTPKIPDVFPVRRDLAGVARQFLDDITLSIQNENVFNATGIRPDKTFLLYGPPGTGKTMAVSAINNELNSTLFNKIHDISEHLIQRAEKQEIRKRKTEVLKITPDDYTILCFSYDIGRYGTAYINRGSARVQRFFDKVGVYSRYGVKTLIEIDEADALLINRRDSHSEDRKVLETLMKNIQFAHDTPNMYVVMMTNLPDVCDDAVLRAQRIDKKYKFDLPTEKERAEAFKIMIRGINERAGYKVIRSTDFSSLSKQTKGCSYADIKTIIEGTVKQKVIQGIKKPVKGTVLPSHVTLTDMQKYISTYLTEFKNINKRPIGF